MKKIKIVLADLFYVNRLTQSRLCVPLNVGYIAAYAKKIFGSDVEISIFKDVMLLLEHLKYNKPDIVGFSFYYWNQNLNFYVVNQIRKVYGESVITVFGGPSVDSIEVEHKKLLKKFPEVDVFIEGEGEAGFANLLFKIISASGNVFSSPIDCSFFSKNDGYIRGTNTSSNLDLSQVPSPYLTGFLDEFLAKSYFPLLQATRTCPYQCTFCVSGKDRSKLRAFPIDQVKEEIDYIAYWNKDRPHVILNLAELNFGINSQDPELARYLKSVSEKVGYPRSVYFYSDKRFTDTSKEVIEALGTINRDGLVFSLQTDHPETLKAIKRKNLSDDNIREGIAWAKQHHIPVTTEVIFGLPYETYDSMVSLLNKSVDQGFDSIMLHNLFVMEGVELNRDMERLLHAMKSKYRLLGNNYMMIDNELIFEYEKVVTQNKYFTFEEFVKIRCLNLMFFSVFQGGFYKFFFQYVKGKGIPLASFFQSFMNPDIRKNWPDEYISFVNDFKSACISELYDDLDSLRKNLDSIYRINNDVGEPSRLNPYYYSRLMYVERGWINEVLKENFKSMSSLINESELNEILYVSEKSIIDLRKLEPIKGEIEINFDLNSWRDDKFHSPIDLFAVDKQQISLTTSSAQLEKLTSFAKVHGHLENKEYYFVAVESIFPRADLFYNMTNIAAKRKNIIETA
jgi:radical SAM superfamily enzyme YgiQ (UPF0313 family)